jgi:hypothetical protein
VTAPAAPVINVRYDGNKARIEWRAVTNATYYKVWADNVSQAALQTSTFPVTGVAATNVLTSQSHGLLTDDKVVFTVLNGGAGLALATTYWVIATGLTQDAFEVSLTQGGAAVDFTTDVTAGSLWKLVWPAHAGLAATVQAAAGVDGWFRTTILVPAPGFIAVSAWNVSDEESALSNEAKIQFAGYPASFPPTDNRGPYRTPFG